ncbi:MAG TPA: hypothetical protein VGF16_15385 [Bryobacteraceae bacterium]|jgi:hypothetical protein
MAQRLIRPTVTILLLLVSLFLPAAPLLQALEAGGEHACCRHKRTSCCPRSHGESAPAAFSSGRECGGTCLLAGPVSPLLGAVLKPAPAVARVPFKTEISLGLISRGDNSPFNPLLLQRPPPAY